MEDSTSEHSEPKCGAVGGSVKTVRLSEAFYPRKRNFGVRVKTLVPRNRLGLEMNSPSQNSPGKPLNKQSLLVKDETLRELLFGIAVTKPDWLKSGFVFKQPKSPLAYGLLPSKVTTRSLVMCVGGYVLKYLLFTPDPSMEKSHSEVQLRPTETLQQLALVRSFSEILWRCGDGVRAAVCLPAETQISSPYPPNEDDSSVVLCRDGLTERLYSFEFTQQDVLLNFLTLHLQMFINPDGFGCLLFLYSLVLTKGFDRLIEELDVEPFQLLNGQGDCSPAAINLVLTGRATPYLHNGVAQVGNEQEGGTRGLVGIEKRSEIGLLLYQANHDAHATQLGSRLKTPSLPIWVTCVNGHFGLLFNPNRDLIRDYHAEKRFDLHYYSSITIQTLPTILNVETRFNKHGIEHKFRPPLESLILTKWHGAQIEWNGIAPFI